MARPALVDKEEKKMYKLHTRAELRSIDNWNRKLEHMYTILTAEEGMSKSLIIYHRILILLYL